MHAKNSCPTFCPTSCPPLPPRPRPRAAPAPATTHPGGEPVRVVEAPPQASWGAPQVSMPADAQPGRVNRATLAPPPLGHGRPAPDPTPVTQPPRRQAPMLPLSPLPATVVAPTPYTPTPVPAHRYAAASTTPPNTDALLAEATRRLRPHSPGPAARRMSAWTRAISIDPPPPLPPAPPSLAPLRSPNVLAPRPPGEAPPAASPAWAPEARSPLRCAQERAARREARAASSVYVTPQESFVSLPDEAAATDEVGSPDSSSGSCYSSSGASSFSCADAARLEREARDAMA